MLSRRVCNSVLAVHRLPIRVISIKGESPLGFYFIKLVHLNKCFVYLNWAVYDGHCNFMEDEYGKIPLFEYNPPVPYKCEDEILGFSQIIEYMKEEDRFESLFSAIKHRKQYENILKYKF